MTGSQAPTDRKYTKEHEWVRPLDGGLYEVGITDHAQAELTDIVYIDLPAVGKAVKAGGTVVVLESVKTVADVYAPFDGTVAEVNSQAKGKPESVNRDPYGAGWLYRLRPDGVPGEAALLDAATYLALVNVPGA